MNNSRTRSIWKISVPMPYGWDIFQFERDDYDQNLMIFKCWAKPKKGTSTRPIVFTLTKKQARQAWKNHIKRGGAVLLGENKIT